MSLRRPTLLALAVAGACLTVAPVVSASPTKAECIAASEQAQQARHAGRLREARAQVVVCVAASCPGPVREDCAQLLEDLDKVMPTLVFEAKDASGNDVSARVTMDGAPFVEKLDGTAILVDPGEHRFVFEAAGLPTAQKTLIIRESDKGRHERIVLGSQLAAVAAPPSSSPTTSRKEEGQGTGDTQRTVGLVLGGAGVVAAVVGSVMGLVAHSTWQSAQNECPGSMNCSTQAHDDGQSANTQATASTVAFVLGGAFLAGGAAVYFTAPKAGDVAVSPTVGGGGAGLSVRGFW